MAPAITTLRFEACGQRTADRSVPMTSQEGKLEFSAHSLFRPAQLESWRISRRDRERWGPSEGKGGEGRGGAEFGGVAAAVVVGVRRWWLSS